MNHISKSFGKTTATKSEEQVYTIPLSNKVRNWYQTLLTNIVMSMEHEAL